MSNSLVAFMPPHRRQISDPKNQESFADRLIRLRKERGLSQAELAAKLGVSQPNVSGYERGESKPGFDVLYDLARVLGVSSDELLGLEHSPGQPVIKDRQLLQHVLLAQQLPKRDRDALLRTIKIYVERVK